MVQTIQLCRGFHYTPEIISRSSNIQLHVSLNIAMREHPDLSTVAHVEKRMKMLLLTFFDPAANEMISKEYDRILKETHKENKANIKCAFIGCMGIVRFFAYHFIRGRVKKCQ